MNRRESVHALAALGAAHLVLPRPAMAQQQDKVWRVGALVLTSRAVALAPGFFIGGFPRGMRERGYVEGGNLSIEWRFADGDLARLAGLAAEIVQSRPDVIVAGGQAAIRAARSATSTIPVVMAGPGDPVAEGFVESLARPGGNTTGAATVAGDIAPKRLELLLAMVPRVSRVAILLNPASRSHAATLASIQAAGQKARVAILPVEIRTSQEIEAAFATMKREKVDAVVLQPDAIFNLHARQIAELCMQQRLPAVAGLREYVDAGVLMCFRASVEDNFRRAAYFVDRIFQGAKPADLPVEQPTLFELFINGKTAKSLGITIPQALLVRADEVIQ